MVREGVLGGPVVQFASPVSIVSSAMADRIINGNTISADIRAELKAEVEKIKAEGLEVPGLVVILVGDRTDSATYVRMKEKACQEIGINSTLLRFPASTTQDEVVAKCALTYIHLPPLLNTI